MNHSQIANTRQRSAIEELGKLVKSYTGGTSTKKRTYLKSGEHIDAVNGVELSDVKLLDGLPEEVKALIKRAENRKIVETIRQQNNIEKVIGIAEVSLEGKECNTNDEVDDDFITRLFDIAKDANKREMQFIWAKILAKEVERPGSFSLRTLEVIRNLSCKDADKFQKVVPLVFNGSSEKVMVSDSKILEKYGIKYEEILLLDDCGLVNSAGMLSLTYKVEPDSVVYLNNNEYAIVIKNKGESRIEFSIGVYALKKPGVELLSILECTTDINYFQDIVSSVRAQNCNLEVTLHPVITINDDGSFKYANVSIDSETVGTESKI